ncbi:MAG: hypothetical protein ACIAXF_16120 [Phycisphaerales bacterium JB063]
MKQVQEIAFRSPARCRGTAMVIVLVAITVGVTLGMTYLATATRSTQVTENIENHTQARLIADAGMQLGIAYIEREPDAWMLREPGLWVDSEPLLGGTISLETDFDLDAAKDPLALIDWSFEDDQDAIPNPALFPPLSRTIGGWDVTRTSPLAFLTGLTVPNASIGPFIGATDQSQVAKAHFGLAILGTICFSQTLAEAPTPNTCYALRVAVGKLSVANVLAEVEVRIWCGATLLASSSDATLLTVLDLSGDTKTYCLRFSTGDTPPTDPFRIELYAASTLGLLSSVFFDDVRFTRESEIPITLTATAEYGGTTHRTQAVVLSDGSASAATIQSWNDE